MNIKGLLGMNQIVSGVGSNNAVQPSERLIKSDNTQDRDANGQMVYEKQKKKQKMTKDQAEKAVALLNEKSFMKDMKWLASLIDEDGFYFAEVVDQEKNVIRRISEFDLWELFDSVQVDTSKGNLLRRTA